MSSIVFKTRIGDQIELQRGKDITLENVIEGQYPVVSSSGISYYHNEYFCNPPGVVLGREGTVGSVFYIDKKFWSHNTTLWVKNFKRNNPKYVYLFFKSISETLKKLDAGSANPGLNRNHIYLLDVKWHKKELQESFCKFIELFENNILLIKNKKNILENMIEKIFLSIFINFEPIYCNINRNFKSLNKIFCSNFPNKIEKKNNLPFGWERKRIDDFIIFKDGKTVRDISYEEGKAKIPVFGANGKFGYTKKSLGIGKTIFLGKIGSCGAINYYNGSFWASNNNYYIEERENKNFEFIFQLLKIIDFEKYIGGSSNPYMPLDYFKFEKIIVPDFKSLEYFKKITDPIRNQIDLLDKKEINFKKILQKFSSSIFSDRLDLKTLNVINKYANNL